MKHNLIDNESLNKLAGYDQARAIQAGKKYNCIILKRLEDCDKEATHRSIVEFIKSPPKAILELYIGQEFNHNKACREELENTIFNLLALRLNKYQMNTSYCNLTECFILTLEK